MDSERVRPCRGRRGSGSQAAPMDAPLVLGDGQQPPGCDEQSAQALPLELRNKLRRYMTVGGLLLNKRHRAALCYGRACWYVCLGYALFRSLDAVEASAGRPTLFAASIMGGFCCIIAVSVIAFILPFYRDAIPFVDAQLDDPVRPATAATLTKALQVFGAHVAYGIIVAGGIIATIVYNGDHSTWSIGDYVTSIAVVALTPPSIAIGMVRTIIYDTAFLLAEDRVRQLAAEVRRAPAASADFNALAKGVFRAHADTERLSSLMQTQVLYAVSTGFLIAMLFLLVAIGPRPPLNPSVSWYEQHWFNIVLHPAVCAVMMTWASCQVSP